MLLYPLVVGVRTMKPDKETLAAARGVNATIHGRLSKGAAMQFGVVMLHLSGAVPAVA